MRNALGENKLIYDIEDPGLYWTRALLRNGTRADSVLKYSMSLKSTRVRKNDSGATNFQARSFFSYSPRIAGVN